MSWPRTQSQTSGLAARNQLARAVELLDDARLIAQIVGLETVSCVLSEFQRTRYLKLAGPLSREIIVVNPGGVGELGC